MPKDSGPPAFLFYPDDFSSDGKVEAMTTEEVGAYILLLCKAWRETPAGSIPNNDLVLARWARLTPSRWAECRTAVLAAFSLGSDSRLHQKRLRSEYYKLKAQRAARSEAAKTAADARWANTNRMRDASDSQCDSNAISCLPTSTSTSISNTKTGGAGGDLKNGFGGKRRVDARFRDLSVDHLRVDAKLDAWIQRHVQRDDRLVPPTEVGRMQVFAAAERAIEVGDKPLGLFRHILVERAWALITIAQEERARQRLLRLRRAGG